MKRLKLGVYFSLWFALSAGYNIANKRVLNAVALPWLHSTATLGVGGAYVLILWVSRLRTPPRLSRKALQVLVPIGLFHAVGHIAAVLSFSAGAVSFTQIVKAAEPVFTCALAAIILKQVHTRSPVRTRQQLHHQAFALIPGPRSSPSLRWRRCE